VLFDYLANLRKLKKTFLRDGRGYWRERRLGTAGLDLLWDLLNSE
jgi:hypothetical protein